MSEAIDTKTTAPRHEGPRRGLFELYRAAEVLDAMLADTEGEITEEVEEAWAELARNEGEALDALISYRKYAIRMRKAADDEAKWAKAVADRYKANQAWTEEKLQELAERRLQSSKKRSFDHGIHTISLKKQPPFCVAPHDVKPEDLPPNFTRWTEPVEARCEVDMSAVRKLLAEIEKAEKAAAKARAKDLPEPPIPELPEELKGFRLARKRPRVEVK